MIDLKKAWLVLIVLIMMLSAGCTADMPETTGPAQTTAPAQNLPDETEETPPLAPDFTVYDAEGNAVKLSAFRGKPVVLNFWASWCGPCKSEMPDFDQVYLERGEQIQFLMVNLTDGINETVEKAKGFIDSAGYSFPVYYDTTGEAANKYGVSSIPTTYMIASDGTLAAYAVGALDMETLLTGISMIAE